MAYAAILPELELTSMIFFLLPVRLKAKHLGYGAFTLASLGVPASTPASNAPTATPSPAQTPIQYQLPTALECTPGVCPDREAGTP